MERRPCACGVAACRGANVRGPDAEHRTHLRICACITRWATGPSPMRRWMSSSESTAARRPTTSPSRRPGRGFSGADRTAPPDRTYPEPEARKPDPRPAGPIRFNGLGTPRLNFFRTRRRTLPAAALRPISHLAAFALWAATASGLDMCGKWIAAKGSVVADLPRNGEGSLEQPLALIELRAQETHLPDKRVTFRRSKLKLGIELQHVPVDPPCICRFLFDREWLVRYQCVPHAQYCERHFFQCEIVWCHCRHPSLA